jgi:hypothetical protein
MGCRTPLDDLGRPKGSYRSVGIIWEHPFSTL